MTCLHSSRAIGPWFETCLLCKSWRLHRYGEPKTDQKRRWWPQSVPPPMVAAEEVALSTYAVDFTEVIADFREIAA